jgi:KDO2-lipid IV(A) lauroyltransferase
VSPFLKLWYLLQLVVVQTLLIFMSLAPLRLVLAAADVGAYLSFILWRSRRRTTIDNILKAGICADDASARKMALASFRSFTTLIAESIVGRRRLTASNWASHVTMKLSPKAEALLRDPRRGLLVASAHIGNWEVAAHAVSMLKPITVAFRPFHNPYLEKAARKRRTGENLRYVSREEPNPMRFVESLSKGEIVALMIDQHVARGHVAVQFFGRPAWTTQILAMLHLTTRAPLLLAFALRTGPLQYEVRTVGPIERPRTGDREKDVFTLTQALTDEIEKVARANPEQYMWGHRRWKGFPGQ